MGTGLQDAGLPPGESPERWNLTRPDVVEAILSSCLEAGSELIETNSFGGSPHKLAQFGLAERCGEINRTAAETARAVAGDRALVLGSMGSTGTLLQPLGSLEEKSAFEGFRLQAEALVEGGVDALCVETMVDLREALIAVSAAGGTGLPVLASLVFESTPRGLFTIMGDDVATAARELGRAGACVIGANCVAGPGAMEEILIAFRRECALPLLAQPNAGIPVPSPGGVIYPEGPREMAAAVPALVEAGAAVIGGCCGTTPEHIRMISEKVRSLRDRIRPASSPPEDAQL
jgi:5-methyltetrahydrofolate--homocysteine methyltransferase